MNKNIRLLVEGFFDDEIFNSNDNSLEQIGDETIKRMLNELNKINGNLTEYPVDFYDYDKAYTYAQLGIIFSAFLKKYKVTEQICFKTKFNKNKYDTIIFYKKRIDDLLRILTINLIDNNIININVYSKDFILPYDKNTVSLYLFEMLDVLVKNKFTVQNIIYFNDKLNPDNFKNLQFNSNFHFDKLIITSELIKNIPNLKFNNNNIISGFKPKISFCLKFSDETAINNFLTYLKNNNIKKINLPQSHAYINDQYFEKFNELLINFAIKNKIELISYTQKDYMADLCYEKCKAYIIKNIKEIPVSYMTSFNIINKMKDNQGSYALIDYEIEFHNKQMEKYLHYNFYIKLYKTGLLQFYKIKLNGKEETIN